ncbi:MAG: hypothetical protein WCG87_06200 [Bacteroidota bacterium]
MKKLYIFLGLSAIAFASCKPNIGPDKPKAGDADFSKYLAVGNSLTSGYADGSLSRSGQINSYPNILATQFAQVGGGSFNQPLLPGESGWPTAKYVLKSGTDCNGNVVLSPVPYNFVYALDTQGSAKSIAAQGPFNNVGVPGIRCIDYLVPGYAYLAAASNHGWAARFYANPIAETPLDEALRLNHSFFTCWLGANDVLGYALAGGAGAVPGPGSNTNDISDTAQFGHTYRIVIDSLVRHGQFVNKAKGMLINVPDVTSIPYFTTIGYNSLALRSGQADTLNALYAGNPEVHFTVGTNNAFVISEPTATNNRRQIKAGEYILLSAADSIKCAGWGTVKPIPAQYVLNAQEVANIETYTTYFNQIILNTAHYYNIGYVDMNAYLKRVQSGIAYDGITFSAQFVSGAAFSLDGIHLTPRGYAMVANYIIANINTMYNANIPMANVSSYDGIKFP